MKVGTGIGSGLVLGGRIHRGAQGAAGDMGHARVGSDAPCRCGHRGCLEAQAGGAALAAELAEAGYDTKNGREAVYCIEGETEIGELDGESAIHDVEPGLMYALDGHEHHLLRAITDFRAVCVFNLPLTGREAHDENGVCPLLEEEA